MKPNIKRQSVNQLLNSLEPGAFERVAKKLTRVKLRPKKSCTNRMNRSITYSFLRTLSCA